MVRLVLPYPVRFGWFIVSCAVLAVLGGMMPLLVKTLFSILEERTPPGWITSYFGAHSARHVYFALLCTAIVVSGLQMLARFLNRYLEAWLSQRVVLDAQNRLAEKLLSMDIGFFMRERTGEIISRMSNDLLFLGRTIKFGSTFISDPLQLIAYLVAIFVISWKLALLGLIGAPLGGYLMSVLSRKMRKASKRAQEKRADITSAMVQFLGGMKIVKAFACEDYESRQFQGETKKLFGVTMKREQARAWMRPVMEFVSSVGMLAVLALAGEWYFNGTIKLNDLTGFIAALMMMYNPAKELSRSNSDLQEALPGADRVFALLAVEPNIVEGEKILSGSPETICFENIDFAYSPDAPVLKDINLEIKRGECVALVGPTGSGKSTMTNLLLRFYDPDRGRVAIDGTDIRDYTFKSLRSRMALVGQDPFLFNGTIRDNIAYGQADATQEKIEAAASAANIHDDILSFPDGYDTIVGERGTNLSGGQRQRVTIARALYKNAPLLILDEATSSLDSVSEKQVQAALDHLMAGRTSLVIAHRLSTIRHADRIVVLENGRITAQGTHEELLELSPTYAKLVQLQNGTGEEK
jgi:subfamily B ATP-binding cassette protein MsbA